MLWFQTKARAPWPPLKATVGTALAGDNSPHLLCGRQWHIFQLPIIQASVQNGILGPVQDESPGGAFPLLSDPCDVGI